MQFCDTARRGAAWRSRNQSSADFQVCRVTDFQIRRPSEFPRAADLEVGDTAGLETCATASAGASRKSSRLVTIFTDTDSLAVCATRMRRFTVPMRDHKI